MVCAVVQDEHPSLPDSISLDMADFLLACFQKDPQRRPDACALLGHAWLRAQRATLRASWSRTVAARARPRTDAHASVSSVVERILRVRTPPTPQPLSCMQPRSSACSPLHACPDADSHLCHSPFPGAKLRVGPPPRQGCSSA